MTSLRQWSGGVILLLCLAGCTGTSPGYTAGVREGADAALAEVATRYRAARHQALLSPAHATTDACGATGRHTLYGTVHVAGGLQNGMWVPPQDVQVVYLGQVVTPACPAPSQTEGRHP